MSGEGMIYQRADKRWCAKLRIGVNSENFKPTYKYFYANTRKEVKDKLTQYKQVMAVSAHASTNTVKYHMTRWLERKKIELKPTSYDRVHGTVTRDIIPYIGSIRINELTPEDIRSKIVIRMTQDGFSRSSIKKAKEALNNCFNYLINNERMLTYNPCSAVSIPSSRVMKPAEIQIMTPREIAKFKSTALSKDESGKYIYPLGAAFVLILNTGIRKGEALALTWDDYDAISEVLSINKSMAYIINWDVPVDHNGRHRRTQIEQTPKSSSGDRIIPLNDQAVDMLEIIRQKGFTQGDHRIICGDRGQAISDRFFSKSFTTILDAAGIKHMGVHALRHTFASRALLSGMNIKILSEILGHSSTEITYNTYIHILQSQKAQEIKMVKI